MARAKQSNVLLVFPQDSAASVRTLRRIFRTSLPSFTSSSSLSSSDSSSASSPTPNVSFLVSKTRTDAGFSDLLHFLSPSLSPSSATTSSCVSEVGPGAVSAVVSGGLVLHALRANRLRGVAHARPLEMIADAVNLKDALGVDDVLRLDVQLTVVLVVPPSGAPAAFDCLSATTLPPSTLNTPASNFPPLRRYWNERLVSNENLFVQLCTINAYIATLGGGYFLCRYLPVAVCLARWQRRVAVALDDRHLAYRCDINQAYSYIHAGHFDQAHKLIAGALEAAKKDEDALLIQVSRSAKLFCRRVRRVARKQNGLSSVIDSRTDELHRVRIMIKT